VLSNMEACQWTGSRMVLIVLVQDTKNS